MPRDWETPKCCFADFNGILTTINSREPLTEKDKAEVEDDNLPVDLYGEEVENESEGLLR